MARKSLQLCNVELVTLIVGASRAIYHVHLNLLCNASSVFKAAFTTGHFEEGNRLSMDLIDDDVDSVDRLVQWLYSEAYTISPFDCEEHANERFNQLARLNTLADKYQIDALSQNIISRMGEPHMERWRIPPFPPRMSVVAYVYDNTSERSDFRKMMVECLKGEPVVTLYVGNDREVFCIHRHLLCNASPVFKAALAGNFRESSELSMNLREEDLDSVNRLVQWLYTKCYEVDDSDSEEHLRARYWQLARLNALADKYDIVTLRNDIVDKFFAIFSAPKAGYNRFPKLELIKYVYTNSSKRCALRDLLAALYCWQASYKWYDKVVAKDHLDSIPGLAVDIVIAMAQKLSGKGDPFEGKASVYHEIVSHEGRNEDSDDTLV
ncbi:hypothetical protein JMJ35_001946 [Cladonia borealis]|uniref:BTB domain-containing protein n=1 Tax=Cladonia borealis TaxID=184061 RepID=A0AA39R6R6_9LECA|nr:hypothetical protein JMJ35_001946 [Cladonia borealis]